MERLNLFLVDRNELFREGLKRLVRDERHTVLGEARTLAAADISSSSEPPVDLLVVDFEGDDVEAYGASIVRIRSRQPDIKIVVLTSERSTDYLIKAIGWSVDAYLFKDMAAAALVKAFQIIKLGQRIFPTPFLMPMRPDTAEEQSPHSASALPRELSPQETEILRQIVLGLSNKAIARELSVSEGTIKAHLKSLLRKVQVSNRTQAAVWALDHGFMRRPAAAAEAPVGTTTGRLGS